MKYNILSGARVWPVYTTAGPDWIIDNVGSGERVVTRDLLNVPVQSLVSLSNINPIGLVNLTRINVSRRRAGMQPFLFVPFGEYITVKERRYMGFIVDPAYDRKVMEVEDP